MSEAQSFSFCATLTRSEGKGQWYQVHLPAEVSSTVAEATADRPRRGFGAIEVRACVGGATWTTSLFPDTEAGTHILFVKKAVRQANGLEVGDTFSITIEID